MVFHETLHVVFEALLLVNSDPLAAGCLVLRRDFVVLAATTYDHVSFSECINATA